MTETTAARALDAAVTLRAWRDERALGQWAAGRAWVE
jgi:hypothetical protein